MRKIKELEDTIRELRKNAEFQERRHLMEVDSVKVKQEKRFLSETVDMSCNIARLEAKNAEMEKRWDSSIQQQQDKLIKALVVKLPEVDIKEIHAHCEKK